MYTDRYPPPLPLFACFSLNSGLSACSKAPGPHPERYSTGQPGRPDMPVFVNGSVWEEQGTNRGAGFLAFSNDCSLSGLTELSEWLVFDTDWATAEDIKTMLFTCCSALKWFQRSLSWVLWAWTGCLVHLRNSILEQLKEDQRIWYSYLLLWNALSLPFKTDSHLSSSFLP